MTSAGCDCHLLLRSQPYIEKTRAEHERVERSESIYPKAHITNKIHDRVLAESLAAKWGTRMAFGMEPLEDWLTTLMQSAGIAWPHQGKMLTAIRSHAGDQHL
jgi:hypothetical protein